VVLVSDPAARENVTRLLSGKGYTVATNEEVDKTVLTATRSGAQRAEAEADVAATEGKAVEKVAVFITSETLGAGSDELGGKLMFNFLSTLPELGTSLWRIILVNGGVKLATADHPCLEKLLALADAGATVLVCGTCLTYFDLMERKAVGQTTNMLDVVTSLQLADKVIRV